MKLSIRGGMMQESPIRKLVPLAEAAEKRGIFLYRLNIGQPEVRTHDVFKEAYKTIPPVIAYGPSNGTTVYRRALQEYYRGIGVQLSLEEIFVTNGGSEAILFALMAILSPGDEVIVIEPFYTNYAGFAVMAGGHISPVSASLEEGFRLPSTDEFEKVLTERTRAIIITNPGNPTGTVFSPKELKALGAFAKRNDLFLIGDEVYREFVYGKERSMSIMELENLEEQAVMIDSVSKRFSACGARIGCMVSRNHALLKLVMKFGQARLCPPTIDQQAAAAATGSSDIDEWLKATVTEYRKRRDVLYEELSRIDGVKVSLPQGAFYIIAELPVEDAEEFARFLLEDFSLDGKSVMLAPAQGFYATKGMGKNQVRLAYVLDPEALRDAAAILKEALGVFCKRS